MVEDFEYQFAQGDYLEKGNFVIIQKIDRKVLTNMILLYSICGIN